MNEYQIGTLRKMEPGTRFTAKHVGGEIRRCILENDENVFVYAPRHRTRGWRFSIEAFSAAYTMLPDTSAADWHKRLDRACRCMRASGLWPDILSAFEKLLRIDYEDWQAMRKIDGSSRWHLGSGGWERQPPEEMDKLWAPFKEKYPFAFIEKDDGHIEIGPALTDDASACKIRSMYFGKRLNSIIKDEFKRAVAEHKKYSARAEAKYDVSISYDPVINKAWYSEEYKGTGNGHYYIALDHNVALFIEDD